MFDVGFWELMLIGVVALLVVGPERLPKLARTAGLWVGRGRRMLGNVKAEIDRELKAEELRQIMEKQARLNPLETIIEEPKPKPKPSGPAGDKSNAEPGSEAGQDPKPGAG